MTSISAKTSNEECKHKDHYLSWAKRMDAQWELRFKKQEPLTEDQVLQTNMRDDQNKIQSPFSDQKSSSGCAAKLN